MKKPTQNELSNAIAGHEPTKPMSILRVLMPQINASIVRGLSKKEIWEGLNAIGLNITYKNFLNCVSRIKKREQSSSDKAPIPQKSQPPGPQETPSKSENERLGMSKIAAGIKESQTSTSTPDYAKIARDHMKTTKGKS